MSSWKKNKLPSQKFKTNYDKYRDFILDDKYEEKTWINWIQSVETTREMISTMESMICDNITKKQSIKIIKIYLDKWIQQFIGTVRKQDYFDCIIMEHEEKVQLKQHFIDSVTSLIHKNHLSQLFYLCNDLVKWSDEFSQCPKPTMEYYKALKQDEKKKKRC